MKTMLSAMCAVLLGLTCIGSPSAAEQSPKGKVATTPTSVASPPVLSLSTYMVSALSTSVNAGGSVTAHWNGPAGGSIKDWVGLFKAGDSNTNYIGGKWIYTNGASAGSYTISVPSTEGSYEFRYLLNDGYTDVARSSAITVTASTAPTPTPPPALTFDFGLINNGGKTVAQGQSAFNTITATQVVTGASSESISFSTSGLPTGSTYSYAPGSCTLNCATSLTINTSASTPTGVYAIGVTGTAGAVSRMTQFDLTVVSQGTETEGNYYVSSGMGAGAQAAGNDSNPGTLAQPFKTLQKAVSMLRAGDILIVRGGEYDTVNGLTTHGGATSIPSGTSWDSPTILKAYAGEKPVFRRYMPAGAAVDEITYRNSWHMPTYEECVGAGLPHDFPHGCWDGGTTGPQEQSAYVGQGPDGYVLQFSNDFPNPAQYIVIDGIDIDARGISNMVTFYAAFHIRFQNLEMRNSIKSGVSQPGLNDETLQTDLQFINVKIHHVGVPYDTNTINGLLARNHPSARFRHAWYMHTGGNTLLGSEISHAAGTALQPAGDNNIIVGNYFHDNNMGVYIDGNNWRICNNVFYNNGMIELYHRSRGSNNTICNNTLVSGPPSPYYLHWGIFLSSGSAGSLYENNIIVSPTGVMNNTGSVHTFRNNLIKSNPGYEYAEEWGVPVVKQNNILGQDPKLVNPAAGDFRLQGGSPAIDKGSPNGLTTDRAGNARPWGAAIDIGAHEYGN